MIDESTHNPFSAPVVKRVTVLDVLKLEIEDLSADDLRAAAFRLKNGFDFTSFRDGRNIPIPLEEWEGALKLIQEKLDSMGGLG